MSDILAGLNEAPVLGILRDVPEKHIKPLLETILGSGLNNIEITLNSAGALSILSLIKKEFGNKINLGAGTVTDKRAAKDAVNAGASFLVAPDFSEEISDYCRVNAVPYFPGALTPSEIHRAWKGGAYMVKLFPASLFGPKYIGEIKAPFKDIRIMAVGGVKLENAPDYFKCGAEAIAVGAGVFKKEWIESSNYLAVGKLVAEYVGLARSLKAEIKTGG